MVSGPVRKQSANMDLNDSIKTELRELLLQKRSGKLDSAEKILHSTNERLWRDTVCYERLKTYIRHHDEEIRLNTLALIVEFKKSTLCFISEELNLIKMFVEYNLSERLEFVPLIKKALKRMKDSLAVIHRQVDHETKMREHYKRNCDESEIQSDILISSEKTSDRLKCDIEVYRTFFKSLRDMCISNPDATYHRRKSSLQILLLLRDFLDAEFRDISWNSEQAEKIFNLLLLDTYESNKEMAFNLLRSMDRSLLGLDKEDRVCDIVTVAIELGNSIRPIDSITAAYMFKVSMLSPVIRDVLRSQFKLKECTNNIMEAVILQLVLLLLKQLEKSLILANENIVSTVSKHSLYGYLFCLRSLLNECNLREAGKELLWQHTIANLISVCFELNHAVSIIVNNSSPEGHLPMDLNLQTINEICDSTPEKELVTPQMVLLCSWRTVKEVSLLFGLLATKSPISDVDAATELLNEDQIIKIGEHLVMLLTETKHRGAFEQAHVGFSQLCMRLWRLNNESLNRLPTIWLHQILVAITGFTEENSKLCATRRSAGVPFMVQALLSSEPRPHKDTRTTTFHSVMKILLGFTELENNINLWEKVKQLMYKNTVFSEYENQFEPLKYSNGHYIKGDKIQVTDIKTHALNILRAVFRHSQLGELVNNYVADGLIAAFKSYDGLTWAERNAATLLFGALIIRIFGVQRTKDHINLTTDNKMNYRMFFEKFPTLLPFILDELQTFVLINDTIIKSNVQSILLLLSRLYLTHKSEETNIQWKIDEVIRLISQCAKSTVYETRQLAARTLVPLLTEESVGDVVTDILENIMPAQKNRLSLNVIHGYMLQILEITKRFSFVQLQMCNTDWNIFLKTTYWILENLERDNCRPACFPLATVYINICHEMYKANFEETPYLRDILHTLVLHLIEHTKLKQGPAREIYKTSVIKFILSVVKKCEAGKCTQLIPPNLLTNIYLQILHIPETQIVAWSTVIDVINESQDNETKMLLESYAVDIVHKFLKDLHKYIPELQDAIFNFLYNNLMQSEKHDSSSLVRKVDICKLVLNKIQTNYDKTSYSERDSYLRLLGKMYVTLDPHDHNQEELRRACVDEVYNSFCDSSWIASLSQDFRTSVFNIMSDLSPENQSNNIYHVQTLWWTTVLQLLVDNISEIRYEAKLLVDKTWTQELAEESTPIRTFIDKFCQFMQDKDPQFACTVLFYWSISLLDDTDYEMDETDVFNKCTNYDFFESVEMSKLCVEFLKHNLEHAIDGILSDDAIDWINARLNVEFPKSISFRTLIKRYKDYLPVLEGTLRDILEPTYKNKLLQVLAYENYESICNTDT